MSQRQLVDEIRWLIDSTCESCAHARCATLNGALLTLVADNPTSTFSTKVMYNIGVRRYGRLTRAIARAQPLARAGAMPFQREAHRSSRPE
jgi:hypothetical protein